MLRIFLGFKVMEIFPQPKMVRGELVGPMLEAQEFRIHVKAPRLTLPSDCFFIDLMLCFIVE